MNTGISILVIDDVESIVNGLEKKLSPSSKKYSFKRYILDPKRDRTIIINEIAELIKTEKISHIISDRGFAKIDNHQDLISRNGTCFKIDDIILQIIQKLDIKVIQNIRAFIIYTYDPGSIKIRRELRHLRQKIALKVATKTGGDKKDIYRVIRTIETSSIYRRPGHLGIYPDGFNQDCLIGSIESCEFYGELLADVLLDAIIYNEHSNNKLSPYSYSKPQNYELLKFVRSFEDLIPESDLQVGSVSCYGNLYGKKEYLVDVPFKKYYQSINDYIETACLGSVFYETENPNSDFVNTRWISFKYSVYEHDQIYLLEEPLQYSGFHNSELSKKWLPLLHAAIFYCKEDTWRQSILEIKPIESPITTVTLFFAIRSIKEDGFKGTFNFTLFSEKNQLTIPEIELLAFEKYAHLLESKLFELILPYKNSEVRKQALQSAVALVFARNFAHNIGSHVAVRATNRMAKERIKELYQIEAVKFKGDFIETWLDYMGEKLDLFGVARNEFLAEYKLPAKNMMLYRDIILPFCENTLLTDNIAHSENIHYINHSINKLKIKVFIGETEIKALYPNLLSYCDRDKISYPDNFPYLVKPIGNFTIDEAFATKNIIGNDIEICLTNEHTIYSILENVIRNSAKHNKDQIKNSNLIINLKIQDNGEDYYTIQIYDNISKVSQKQLNGFADSIGDSLITEDGEIQKRSLGIADIKINAHLLKTDADISNENLKSALTLVYQKDKADQSNPFEEYEIVQKRISEIKEYNFGYQFKLCKPKKVIWIGDNISATNEHKKKGLISYKSLVDFKQEKNSSLEEPLTNCQFAILELDAVKDLKNEKDNYNWDDFLIKLPRRILLNATEEELKGREAILELIKDGRIELVKQIFILPETNKLEWDFWFLKDCWENWLRKWLSEKDEKSKQPRLIVYFEDENRAKEWQQITYQFSDIKFDFLSPATLSDKIEISDNERVVFFDHHAKGLDKLTNENKTKIDFINKGAYFQFGKNSQDFIKFFYPSNNKCQNILFLYEAYEAGLNKIIVVDERIAEMLNYHDPDNIGNKITCSKKFNTNKYIGEYGDLGNNGNIFIVSKFLKSELNSIKKNITLGFSNQFTFADEPFTTKGELKFDSLIIHRTHLISLFEDLESREKNKKISKKEVMHLLYKKFNRVVVVSGGGYPHSINFKVQFKPFSQLKNSFIQYPSKISLTNIV